MIEAGQASEGKMQYQLGTDDVKAPTGTWSETLPQGAQAGDYYVWYRAYLKDTNTSDPECVKVIIKPESLEDARVVFYTTDGSKNNVTSLPYNGSEYSVGIKVYMKYYQATPYMFEVSGTTTTSEPAGELALVIRVAGLLGGTADADISKGRANAIVVVASILQDLENRGVPLELASFNGGTAANTIPSEATATVVIAPDAREALESTAKTYIDGLKNTFAGIEANITLEITETAMPAEVVSNDDRRNALWFMTEIVDGVSTWQKGANDQPESSSNLGVFSLGAGGVTAATSVRSASADRETELVNKQVALAAESGYTAQVTKLSEL